MARRFLSFETPFPILAEHLAKDKDFVSDAKTILQIDDDKVRALGEALAQTEFFLDRRGLSAVVDHYLGPGENSANVSRIVWRLNQILRDVDEPLDKAVVLLKESIGKFSEGIAEDDRKKLGERLDTLVAAPPTFARQHKAEKLAEATGGELEDIQIICDIRPVFNEDRSEIEGAIPVTMLRLDTIEVDGSSSSIEIRLTEQQIADLCVKADFAKNKISVIKKTLADTSITMPFTSATIDERGTK